jgi:hypothetical protein
MPLDSMHLPLHVPSSPRCLLHTSGMYKHMSTVLAMLMPSCELHGMFLQRSC